MSTKEEQISYSERNLIDLSEFMIDNRRAIICPKCDSLPLFLSTDNNNLIYTLCLKCKNIKSYELQKILDFISPNTFHLDNCNFKKHKTKKPSVSYCLNCKKWLCKNCYNSHNTINYNDIHLMNKTGPIIQTHCSKHNGLQYESSCMCCSNNLCKDCYEQDICPVTKIKHDLMKNDKFLSQYVLNNEEVNEEILQKIQIMKDIKNYWKQMKLQKEAIVKKLQEIIYQIEYNFNNTYNKNKKIFSFFESFLSLFSNGNNFYILKHLNFLSNPPKLFDFDIDNFNSLNIEDYINYLQKDFSFTFGIKQNKELNIQKCSSVQISKEPSVIASYNKKCYVGYKNGYIDVCDYVDGQLQKMFSIRKHTLIINQFNQYKEYILSSSKDGIINLWKEVQKEKEFQLNLESTLNVKEEIDQVIIFEQENKTFLLITSNVINSVNIWNFSPKEGSPEKIITIDSQLQCYENINAMKIIKKSFLLISTVKETLSLWSIPQKLNTSIIRDVSCEGSHHLSISNNFIFVVGQRYITFIKMLNPFEESESENMNNNYQLMILYRFNVELNQISMKDILLFSSMNYNRNNEDERFIERVVLLCRKEIITIIFNSSFDYIIRKENISRNKFEEVKFYKMDNDNNQEIMIFQLNREKIKFSGSFLSIQENNGKIDG